MNHVTTPPKWPPVRAVHIHRGRELERNTAYSVQVYSPFAFGCFVDRWSTDEALCNLWLEVAEGRKPTRRTIECWVEGVIQHATPGLVAEQPFAAEFFENFQAYVVKHKAAHDYLMQLPRYSEDAVKAQAFSIPALAHAAAKAAIEELRRAR